MHATTKGTLLVITTAIVSGVSIFLNDYAVKGFDSSVFTFSKNLVVALFLVATILGLGMLPALKRLTRTQWLGLAGIGLVGGSVPFLLFFRGLQLTTATTGSFLHTTLFVWVALFAVLALKEKLDWRYILGAALLLAGTFVITRPTQAFGAGDWLIIGSVILWAAETVWAKRLLTDMTGTIVAFGRMFFGSAFLLLFLIATGKASMITSMASEQYLWILATAALLFLYVITYYVGLRYVQASTAASLLVLAAPITAGLEFAFRGTPPTASTVLGNLLILAGTASVVWFSLTARRLGSGAHIQAHE